MLFSNRKVNFNFDTMASILSLLYFDVKSYRSAIYTHRMIVLNAIPTLLQQHLLMLLVPKESLLASLQSVGDELVLSGSRLSLAIPPNSDITSYYDAKLLRDVATVNEGLILTLTIPLASRQTVFSTYSARVVPMPQTEPRMAIKWVIEDPYLAISEDQMESMTISQAQYESCLGSSRYKICHEHLASQANHPSCLATLFLSSSLKAAETCNTGILPPDTSTGRLLGIRHMAAHLCNRHIRNARVQPTGATQIVESTNSRLQNLYNYCCLWFPSDSGRQHQTKIWFGELR